MFFRKKYSVAKLSTVYGCRSFGFYLGANHPFTPAVFNIFCNKGHSPFHQDACASQCFNTTQLVYLLIITFIREIPSAGYVLSHGWLQEARGPQVEDHCFTQLRFKKYFVVSPINNNDIFIAY
jgi:hypothetical protein